MSVHNKNLIHETISLSSVSDKFVLGICYKRPIITLSFVIKRLFITLSFVIKHPFITLSFITKHPFITLSFRSKIGREGFHEQHVFADAQSAEAYRNGHSLFSRKFWYIRESWWQKDRHYSSLCNLQFICGEVDGLLYSSSHIPWRNSILFTEGVIEAWSMFKTAAEGYIVYAHFWVGLE